MDEIITRADRSMDENYGYQGLQKERILILNTNSYSNIIRMPLKKRKHCQ